jgi:hypothetical protein
MRDRRQKSTRKIVYILTGISPNTWWTQEITVGERFEPRILESFDSLTKEHNWASPARTETTPQQLDLEPSQTKIKNELPCERQEQRRTAGTGTKRNDSSALVETQTWGSSKMAHISLLLILAQ